MRGEDDDGKGNVEDGASRLVVATTSRRRLTCRQRGAAQAGVPVTPQATPAAQSKKMRKPVLSKPMSMTRESTGGGRWGRKPDHRSGKRKHTASAAVDRASGAPVAHPLFMADRGQAAPVWTAGLQGGEGRRRRAVSPTTRRSRTARPRPAEGASASMAAYDVAGGGDTALPQPSPRRHATYRIQPVEVSRSRRRGQPPTRPG